MIDGTINTVVECNPLLAQQVYEAALKAVNGETLPKWVPSDRGRLLRGGRRRDPARPASTEPRASPRRGRPLARGTARRGRPSLHPEPQTRR